MTDGGGVIYHDERVGQDMHVCTADYVQTVGRVHCRDRRVGSNVLDRRRTTFVGDLPDCVMGLGLLLAHYQRLALVGAKQRPMASSRRRERRRVDGDPEEREPTGSIPAKRAQRRPRCLLDLHSMENGRTAIRGSIRCLGPMLGDRGLADVTLDELDAARAESSNTTEMEDVAWFFDAFTNLWPRDIPSEFHYHVRETGERQACLRSYFATNTQLRARPSGWNLITESIVGGLAQFFAIGDCKTHPMSVRFCGELGASEGAPTFTLDESSIRVEMEPYPRLKPSCNNNFVPLVKDGLAEGVRKLTGSVITDQLNTLTADLPFEIRRVELTPSGALPRRRAELQRRAVPGDQARWPCTRRRRGAFLPP